MRNFRRFFIICIFLSVLILPMSFAYPEEPFITHLNLLIDEALENNPEIKAAYNHWKAIEHKVKQVRSLPDPMANYTYFGENIETRVGPQEQKFGASQKIPFPGKLKLKGKAKTKQAEMFKEKYEATKREVIKNVKFVFYDIFWVDKAIQINEEEKAILESLEKVAQRRYEVNFAPQQDVIKVQVELSKLIDKLFHLKENRKSLVAKLNSLLNRSKDENFQKLKDVKPAEFKYSLEELHQIAQSSSQKLLEANLDIERAKYEKSLARLDYFPDFTFGFDYIQVGSGHTTSPNDGQDAWMGMMTINVPIWFNKLKAQIREKEAELEASQKKYENLENTIVFEVKDIYYKISTYKDIISLYETALIPQTKQSFQAAKTAYETGKVDFLNWLDSERVLLQTRLAYYKTIVDYQKSMAYLERIVGKDLSR